LKIFKLYEHPAIRPQIEVTKTQVMEYQALAAPSSHLGKGSIAREGHFRLVRLARF